MERFDDDPVLSLLPGIDDLPAAFWRMRLDEQRWRGRLYLTAWVLTQHSPMAWHFALGHDAMAMRRGRPLVETIDDDRIVREVNRLRAVGKRP